MKRNFMKSWYLFVCFFLLGVAIMLVYALRITPVATIIPKQKIPPINSKFSLENAPAKSLKAAVITLTGTVLWLSRTATESSKLLDTTPIQQGTGVETKDGTLALQFSDQTTLSLLPNTKIDIIQTLPDSFVFLQYSGIATYKKVNTSPLSVRGFHLLLEQSGGEMIVQTETDIGKVRMSIKGGSATAAYNDNDNLSTIVEIPDGKSFVFDDATRTHLVK